MLVLHGFPFSNYHNIVKHALLWKGIPFEEKISYPGSTELMAINPTGKAPAMTTEKGTRLSESAVLVEYLEDAYPQNPLLPTEPDAKAKVRQLMKISELYLELPARRLLPALLGDATFNDATLDEIRATLDRGTRSLVELGQFSPFVAGNELTMADIYLRYALAIPIMVGPKHLKWDVMEAVPGLSAWHAMMAESEISQSIDADLKANTADFMAHVAKTQQK
ncbi:MAG: glutathione S-transferase family protein [Halioglobus sp.]|nr:glutathione S-transferase family protein [Halioglobus sp.]